MTGNQLTVHPFAERFPLMGQDELQALANDIRQHGLRHPVLLTPNGATIVDGRNRIRACALAGREVVYERLPWGTSDVEIVDRIMSENVARRHLTEGQRAMLGADYEDAVKEAVARDKAVRQAEFVRQQKRNADGTFSQVTPDADQKSRERGRHVSRVKAAKLAGSSPTGVARAVQVKREAPDLEAQVRSGQMKVSTAARIAHQRKEHGKVVATGPNVQQNNGITTERRQRYAFTNGIPALRGMALVWDSIDPINPAFTADEINAWLADLIAARRSLERLINRLRSNS